MQLILIADIAIRPCTGALFVHVLITCSGHRQWGYCRRFLPWRGTAFCHGYGGFGHSHRASRRSDAGRGAGGLHVAWMMPVVEVAGALLWSPCRAPCFFARALTAKGWNQRQAV